LVEKEKNDQKHVHVALQNLSIQLDRPGRRSTMHTWRNCNEQASIFFPRTHAIKLQQRCSDFRTRTFKVIAVYLLQESLCPMMRESSHAVGYTMKAASAVAALLAHHF
jgi:hypothetical protein